MDLVVKNYNFLHQFLVLWQILNHNTLVTPYGVLYRLLFDNIFCLDIGKPRDSVHISHPIGNGCVGSIDEIDNSTNKCGINGQDQIKTNMLGIDT